jgi:DNA modification methylase
MTSPHAARQEIVFVGDARSIPLPDGSVQCVVTSPPYYGLRDYGVDGQIGSEGSLDEFLGTMVDVMREVRRVMRDDGTAWINMGDSFATPTKGSGGATAKQLTNAGSFHKAYKTDMAGLRQKCKRLVPHRLAIALCDDGWILRQDIVWAKPNPMPESTRDRPTTAHEFMFLLTKQPRYYYDADAIREPLQVDEKRGRQVYNGKSVATSTFMPPNPAGRNKRSVWTIPSHPFPDAHFATFPPALVAPCVRAGSAVGDVVLDPFCGSGTTGVVARQMGRSFVGVELNPEYAEMARERIKAEGEGLATTVDAQGRKQEQLSLGV